MPAHDFQPDIDAVGRIDAVPRILDLICKLTGMGFAAVARVTEDRWIACRVRDDIAFGLVPGGELKVETTICNEIRQSHEPVVIDNVDDDPAYCDHHTPAMYGFKSYISLPIVLPDGRFFGTLCAIDPHPATLNTPETRQMFALFAELIAVHLDTDQRLRVTEAILSNERAQSELREQFIAVLGHDLRNPLAAIDAASRLLTRSPAGDKAPTFIAAIQSSVRRMSGLITNILDFARARLGGGFTMERTPQPVRPILDQVISEFRISAPEHVIETAFELAEPVACDPSRLAQLFSNLLGNALTHGATDMPVHVAARTADGQFELSVANGGDPIPPEAMELLFQPFSRGDVRPSQQGLGLGLYIASEIARAHGGTLDVASSSEETRFTFRMPLA